MFTCTYTPQQHGQRPAQSRRGHAHVHHDGKVWQYHVPKGQRRAFRQFLVDAFNYRGQTVVVSGAYPSYHVEI